MSTFTRFPRRLALHAALAFAMLAAGALPARAQQAQAEIETLLAKQAITEQLYRYPRALDRHDRDLLMSIGHPEAKVTFGKTVFPNWAALVDFMAKAHEPMRGNNHRITNILIEVRGDKAVSESSGTATLMVKNEGSEDFEERWMHSRYLDRWERRNGKWGIVDRQTVMDYRTVRPVPAAVVNDRQRYQIAPHVGRDDPSYKLFGSNK